MTGWRMSAALWLMAVGAVWAQSDAKEKLRALKDLSRQGSGAIERIAPYLRDEGAEVRREAVKALVEIGTQRSLEPLVEATKDNDPEVQIRAADGLVNFYLPGYVERGFSATLKRAGNLISGRWQDGANEDAVDPDMPVRAEIVAALARLAEGGSSMDSRANAARALGILRARGGTAALVSALRSKDSRLMYEALIALQKIKDRSVADRVAFLVRDLDEKVQLAAIEAAGILGSREAVPELKRVLESPKNKKVRRAALTALAQIGDEGSRPMMLTLLGDKDEQVRAAAAEGLGRLRHAEDGTAIEKAWSAESKIVARLALAFARARLGNLETGSFSPLGYLVNNLNQRAWRGVAEPYLSELALDKGVRAALYGLMGEGATKDEKVGLARALAGCRAADAVGPLEKLAKDEDVEVAREALRALRILKGGLG